MSFASDYVEGLTKQVFIRDYLLNGLFPSQSAIVKSIRHRHEDWKFNNKFEYRMLLSTTNSGGTLNDSVFNRDWSMARPGNMQYGIFRASYGTIMDGFSTDMISNLETQEGKAAFISTYVASMYSCRVNLANIFKGYCLYGRFGVVHQISADDATVAGTPAVNVPFEIIVPLNVYHTGFKTGKYLIKTTTSYDPSGPANVEEIYMIVQNHPHSLVLVAVPGTTPTAWVEGQMLEQADNRVEQTGLFRSWGAEVDVPGYPGVKVATWTGTAGVYTNGDNSITGAMEGIADLFPFYCDANGSRQAQLAHPFRDQPNRLVWTTEQAGNFVYQKDGESIIDAVLRGVALARGTIPYGEFGTWCNPETLLAMGYQEGETGQYRTVRDITSSQPIVGTRGVGDMDFYIGSKHVPLVMWDDAWPTDVVMIAPKDALFYNAWGNTLAEIDQFVTDYDKGKLPKLTGNNLPPDFVSKLDIRSRVTVGAPYATNGTLYQGAIGSGGFMHPGNYIPIALHEMGALFTEHPYAYTVVKLRKPIIDPTDP